MGTILVGFYPSAGLDHLVRYRFETPNLPYTLYPRDCPRDPLLTSSGATRLLHLYCSITNCPVRLSSG
jgi:hypothetical protein